MRRTIAEVRKLVKQGRKTRIGKLAMVMPGLVLISFSFGHAPGWVWLGALGCYSAGFLYALYDDSRNRQPRP